MKPKWKWLKSLNLCEMAEQWWIKHNPDGTKAERQLVYWWKKLD